jgi:hypothetical protein
MTEKEVENIRNELFEDDDKRNQERIEKLTAEIKPTEAEASYPESVRLRLEEQRQSLRDILIEGNNLLPWREATTDLDELRKALSIYAAKRNSKNPGDETAGYARDIARKIQRYRDWEAFIEIEKEQKPTTTPVIKDPGEAKERDLPTLPELEEIANKKNGILRKWVNGKYKCSSLPRFIVSYIKMADNLTPALIRDYLICERTGKPYSDKNIEKEMKVYGPGRRST